MAKSDHSTKQIPLLESQPALDGLLKPAKTIRIAQAGDVLVTQLECQLIDTPDFQRLRRVRQLGTACMVFPTALHTRFDHSLGTLAMAARMLDRIESNSHSEPDERTIPQIQKILTRLYALLHDVPHVPYGHTLEDELGVFPRHDANQGRIEHFFGLESQIGRLISATLTPAVLDRFLAIYQWDKKTPLPHDDAFVYDIVSNTVCADLLDYLARDNYFCDLGVTLEYRFLNFLYLKRDAQNRRRVFVRLFKASRPVPRRDTLTDLCRLLETRYLIAERVYFHHAKVISGAMLGRAVYEAVAAKELSEADLYGHSDDTLLLALARSKAAVAQRLAHGLWTRALHKQLHKYQEEEFLGVQAQDHTKTVLDDVLARFSMPGQRQGLEDRIADEVGAMPGDILIYCPQRKMNLKVAQMKVIWEGKEQPFCDISDPIINPRLKEIVAAHRKLWGVWIFVSPQLDAVQRQLVKLACDLELLVSDGERSTRTRQYYEALVERQLLKELPNGLMAQNAFGARDAVVADLTAVASDRRPFPDRLRESIQRHFRVEGRPG